MSMVMDALEDVGNDDIFDCVCLTSMPAQVAAVDRCWCCPS